MEVQSHSQSGTSEERLKNLARSADVLAKYFQKWSVVFPNHPTGGRAVAIYVEALSDLTPDQIEAGCAEAIKTAEQFPKPGHIRAAVPTVQTIFLGPSQLTYPETTQEERDAALEYSAPLRARLAASPRKELSIGRKQINLPPSKFSVDEQKEILRRKGYL